MTTTSEFNEEARLKEFIDYSILDTSQEVMLNELIEIASLICDTPISLISFIDEKHQMFKVKKGLEITKTAREDSFCQHALHRPNEILVVEDSLKDSRFKKNRLVLGPPSIRFYAGAPLVTPNGNVLGTLCVIDQKPRKITENQKKALQILANRAMNYLDLQKVILFQKEKMELDQREKQLTDLKKDFVSMASHEFKTPLSNISFAAEYIERYLDRASKEQINERAKKIKQQVKNMMYLLNNILALGKSEETKLKTSFTEININDFISQLKEETENNNQSHKIALELDLPEDLVISSDPVFLSNVFNNLLQNAIKYSPGKEEVIWKIKACSDGLTSTVQDFGPGISPEEQTKIFEPFYRSHKSSKIEGTGLGLTIVKRATESLGGEISLVNSSEKGSTFKFTLPIN